MCTSVPVLEGLNLPVEGGDHGGVLLLQPADAALQPRDPLLGAARAATARHGGGRPLPHLGLAMVMRGTYRHHPPAVPGECPWPPGGHGPGGAGGRAQPAPAGTFSSCDERMERSSNSFFLKWDNSIIVIQLSPIIIME